MKTSVGKQAKNHCAWCGKPLPSLPFKLDNVVCKDCYGPDRYRRQTGPKAAPDIFIADDLDEAA